MFEWFGKVSFCPHTKISEFANHLKDGRLMGSRCASCEHVMFPPRADCPKCLGAEFTYFELSGKGTVVTFTRIDAAPTGFEDLGAYVVGVVDLAETGRLLAPFGDSIPEDEIEIGMEVQVVPRIFEEIEDLRVHYSLERPGTTWAKASSSG